MKQEVGVTVGGGGAHNWASVVLVEPLQDTVAVTVTAAVKDGAAGVRGAGAAAGQDGYHVAGLEGALADDASVLPKGDKV